ncbi:MAG: ABC transporter permease [Syntrophomonadaceae bacterium]|nr:ABC transporter permease [Syntrophomonadaceae bacterium]
MQVLNRRLIRMIWNTRGQFLALIAIVMLGVLIYISMTTAYMNLSRSQQSFYQENEFADYFLHVVKAPEAEIKRVANIPGVVQVTGRIQKDISFIKADGGRGTLRLTSYKLPVEGELNQIQVDSGRMFAREGGQGIEVLVDPKFAAANRLKPGSLIKVIAGSREVSLNVVGTAVSPEFIYLMKDSASLMPEPEEFGVLMMPHENAEQITDMQGQINQFLLKLVPGADEEEIKEQAEAILEPYGNLAAYNRDKQLSHLSLKGELEGLRVSSRFLPLIFFLVAAGIQFLLLGRMIKAQRSSIGVMKALGLGNMRIVMHFLSYPVCVSLLGSLLGSIFGIYLASIFSQMYAMFFNLPASIGGINGTAILYSVILTLLVGISSGLLACRGILLIQPAEAMRTAAPVGGGSIALEKLSFFWNSLNSAWRMSLRTMFRNRTRFAVTVLGVAGTVVILLMAFFSSDATDYMMERHFSMENRYDFRVTFNAPLKQSDITYWQQWEEIEAMEASLQVPIKVSKDFSGSDEKIRSEDDSLQGLRVGQKLLGIYLADGQELQVPENGVLLSERTAKKLAVQVGDWIWVESKMGVGPSHQARLKVTGIPQALLGGGSYVSLETANRLLGESRLFNSLLLKIDTAKSEQFKNRLKNMTAISSVLSRTKERANWDKMMESMIFFIGVMILFGGVLGLVIIYNSSLMNFNERKKELASLRVIGFTRQEIGNLLFKETAVQAIAGIIIGLPLGRWLGGLYIGAVSTDLYTMPVIIYTQSYFIVAGCTIIFILAGFGLVLPKLKQIDLVEALKNQD